MPAVEGAATRRARRGGSRTPRRPGCWPRRSGTPRRARARRARAPGRRRRGVAGHRGAAALRAGGHARGADQPPRRAARWRRSRRPRPPRWASWSSRSRTDEAAEALAQRGARRDRRDAAVDATGGWVTGVLFEAWRSVGDAGRRRRRRPIRCTATSSAHILDELARPSARLPRDHLRARRGDRAARRRRSGIADAVARLGALRSEHLPVTWTRRRARRCAATRASASTCSSASSERGRRGGAGAAHRARPPARARGTATRRRRGAAARRTRRPRRSPYAERRSCRRDRAARRRGRGALAGAARRRRAGGVARARRRRADARASAGEDFRRAELVVDRVTAQGERERLAGASSLVAALMAWCYVTSAGRRRPRRCWTSRRTTRPSPRCATAYSRRPTPGPPPPRPALTGGPLDALVLATDYCYGRLSELAEHERLALGGRGRGRSRGGSPSLRALGRTQRALELYEAMLARSGPTRPASMGTSAPEVLIDAGPPRGGARGARARTRAGPRERLGRSSRSHAAVADAQARAAARARPGRRPRGCSTRRAARWAGAPSTFLAESIDTWYGLALLLLGEDGEALRRLRRAVASMLAGASACSSCRPRRSTWPRRSGAPATRTPPTAPPTSRSTPRAARAPTTCCCRRWPTSRPSCRAASTPSRAPSSPWHELGRALIAQGTPVGRADPRGGRAASSSAAARSSSTASSGARGSPRPTSCSPTSPAAATGRAERDELLDALFDGRADDVDPRLPAPGGPLAAQRAAGRGRRDRGPRHRAAGRRRRGRSASRCASRRCSPRPRGCRASSGSPRRSPRSSCTTGASTCPTAARAGWTERRRELRAARRRRALRGGGARLRGRPAATRPTGWRRPSCATEPFRETRLAR